MSQVKPPVLRPPLATRSMLNNMSDGAWSHEARCESLETVDVVYMQHDEDGQMIGSLENACRFVECGWGECEAELGSWELLRKHVVKVHCQQLSSAALGKASSSRPYRCRYASCSNRIFSDPALLLEHVVTAHLEVLKLRCPFGCKQPSAVKLQSLVQHLSSVHRKTIMELPSAQMHLFSPRQIPLPDLPAQCPTFLASSPLVMPCATFIPSKPKSDSKPPPSEQDTWEDFLDMVDTETGAKFAKLKYPDSGQVTLEMRPEPRGPALFDGMMKPVCRQNEDDPIEETIGFETWKRRFDAEEEEASSSLKNDTAKKRRKS